MTTTKQQLLQCFQQSNGEPISGQLLADTLQISRTAVWKQIQSLQQQGYEIETVARKGYKLVQRTSKLVQEEVMPYLQTKRYGRTIYHFDETTTTQAIAHEQVRQGAPDGTVIIAETQTAGKGRLLREWDSSANNGIWMTLIIRPEIAPNLAPQFTLVAAVAIVNAIKALHSTIDVKIKWPNDLLINGKKMTGILTEMIAEVDRVEAILVGIGINVNQQAKHFPQELQSIATSLSMELGQPVNRAELVAVVLYYFEHYSDLYVKHGFSRIRDLWLEASDTIGRPVRATTLREVIEGTARSITNSGVLQIECANGELKEVYSADIELL